MVWGKCPVLPRWGRTGEEPRHGRQAKGNCTRTSQTGRVVAVGNRQVGVSNGNGNVHRQNCGGKCNGKGGNGGGMRGVG